MVKFEILKCVIFLTSKIIFISGTNTCLLCTLIFVGPMACMSIHKIQQYPGMYPQGRPVRPRSHLNIQIPYPYPPQRGQILPTIAEVASKFSQRLHPWVGFVKNIFISVVNQKYGTLILSWIPFKSTENVAALIINSWFFCSLSKSTLVRLLTTLHYRPTYFWTNKKQSAVYY